MAAPSNTLSPIAYANEWSYFTLGDVDSPGTIAQGGMTGFKRETGWDIKKGKGTQGATLTLKDIPPIEGKIVLNLITDLDFANYDTFVLQVLSVPAAQQEAEGLTFFHPSCSSIGLTQVVVKHYTSPKEVGGKRKYQVEIELLEWQPPPAASVVKPVAPAPGAAKGPRPQSPEAQALQVQIAASNAAAAAARAAP